MRAERHHASALGCALTAAAAVGCFEYHPAATAPVTVAGVRGDLTRARLRTLRDAPTIVPGVAFHVGVEADRPLQLAGAALARADQTPCGGGGFPAVRTRTGGQDAPAGPAAIVPPRTIVELAFDGEEARKGPLQRTPVLDLRLAEPGGPEHCLRLAVAGAPAAPAWEAENLAFMALRVRLFATLAGGGGRDPIGGGGATFGAWLGRWRPYLDVVFAAGQSDWSYGTITPGADFAFVKWRRFIVRGGAGYDFVSLLRRQGDQVDRDFMHGPRASLFIGREVGPAEYLPGFPSSFGHSSIGLELPASVWFGGGDTMFVLAPTLVLELAL